MPAVLDGDTERVQSLLETISAQTNVAEAGAMSSRGQRSETGPSENSDTEMLDAASAHDEEEEETNMATEGEEKKEEREKEKEGEEEEEEADKMSEGGKEKTKKKAEDEEEEEDDDDERRQRTSSPLGRKRKLTPTSSPPPSPPSDECPPQKRTRFFDPVYVAVIQDRPEPVAPTGGAPPTTTSCDHALPGARSEPQVSHSSGVISGRIDVSKPSPTSLLSTPVSSTAGGPAHLTEGSTHLISDPGHLTGLDFDSEAAVTEKPRSSSHASLHPSPEATPPDARDVLYEATANNANVLHVCCAGEGRGGGGGGGDGGGGGGKGSGKKGERAGGVASTDPMLFPFKPQTTGTYRTHVHVQLYIVHLYVPYFLD